MYRISSQTNYNRNMIKEFTPPGLRLLGPTSNGLGLSIMLKFTIKVCLQCSNASETYLNEFIIAKNARNDSLYIQFG